MANISISGFMNAPEQNPNGSKYTGRLCCDDVQVTGEGADAMVTFTITARQLLDASDSQMLWTDQDVQRGVRPEVAGKVDRILPLSIGYPDSKLYNFNAESADDMTDKLLHGQRLFVNPLVWNMRPNHFEAYFDEVERKIYIYGGKIYLPDSHHRHQAIIKAAKTFRLAPMDYPKFDLSKQFKVELYFLKREDEGNYFFDKNQRPTPTAKSKAYDLTTVDDLSMLAKKVVEFTPSLQGNVNRVTDRLTSKNPDVVTLSTLRESLKLAADVDGMDEAELQGIAHVASEFFILLTQVRSEIGLLPLAERKAIRAASLVDAPIMFQGYGALIADFNVSISSVGFARATDEWQRKLQKLGSGERYREGIWNGDFFDKYNPMWTRLGVVKPGLSQRPTVSNNRSARIQVSKALRAVVNSPSQLLDLMQIVR